MQGSDDPISPFSFVHEFEGFTSPNRLVKKKSHQNKYLL